MLVAGAAALVGVFSFIGKASASRPLPKAKPPTLDGAVKLAIKTLGAGAHPYTLTDFAYAAAYPQCPSVIDPADPEHDECRELWLQILTKVFAAAGIDPDAPLERPDPSTSTGIAADIARFLSDLTVAQRAKLRTILGASRYDNIVASAEAGSDASVQAQLMALRRDVEKLVAESPLQAFALYNQLQTLLGEAKLKDFLAIAK
jgi:hypothetical protein